MSEQSEQSVIVFSGPQDVALRALAGGAHVMEAAQEAGVARETVSRWLAREEFRAELLRRRESLWAAYQDRLTKMVGESLDGLYVLTHGPEYYGNDKDGRSFYDPRVRLEAIQTVLRISGLLPQRGPGLAVQVNVAQQQVTQDRAPAPIDAEY